MTNNSQSPRDISMCYLSKLLSHYLPQLTVSILSLLLLEPNKHIPALETSALQASLLVQMRNLGHRIQRSKVVQMPILRGTNALNFDISFASSSPGSLYVSQLIIQFLFSISITVCILPLEYEGRSF